MYALKNCIIHTATETLDQHSVVVKGDTIAGIVPVNELDASINTVDLKGLHLAPAFIDIQIYGGNGSLFNSKPTPETIAQTYQAIRRAGTTLFQITLSTTPLATMLEAITAAKQYQANEGKGLAGIHLEGPFFSFPKRGAHVAAYVRKPTVEEIQTLIEATQGIATYMTIAPEEFTDETLAMLHKSPIVLSAGHSSATYQQATRAFEGGIKRVTHLFNAMSAFQSRDPGLVGATFDAPDVMASIIPDGIHVDFTSVRIAKKIMGERLFIITDAVTEDVSGDYKFVLAGNHYTDTKGILSGSALTMMQGVANCCTQVGIPLDESLRMAATYPAQALQLAHVTGRLEEGYWANMVLFDNDFQVHGIIEAGFLEWFFEV